MTQVSREHVILANGAESPERSEGALRLDYRDSSSERNMRITLPRFVANVYHLSNRVLDLLEIASYVFAADRRIYRGEKDSVEFHSWSRVLHFYIRVRDHEFWSAPQVKQCLSEALRFMTGDSAILFTFEPGHSTPPTSLFDNPRCSIESDASSVVTLFSGGLDSLCGVVDLLTESSEKVVIVSHESRTGTVHTQRALFGALKDRFPGRVLHYPFGCTLSNGRASDETQRSRSFLYTAIAYALASAYGRDRFNVYENGVTSINLHRREDLMNGRASRTTHPQTMSRLASLYSLIGEKPFQIHLPYLSFTKADVIARLHSKSPRLISRAVSCTKTFKLLGGGATHCGYCFQCIDRRIAGWAAHAEDVDHRGLYDHDIISDPIDDAEGRTGLVDYVRQAKRLADQSVDGFADEYLSELGDLLDYVFPDASEADKIMELWRLFRRHGNNVKDALTRMRNQHDDIYRPVAGTSLLGIVSNREHLKPEVIRLCDSLMGVISPALGNMFRRNKPKNENDLNQKLAALLTAHKGQLRSEHPTASFACARVVPDHSLLGSALLIEAKYITGNTPPSKATEGIAADLTKYPPTSPILFVIYDPSHRIDDDTVFCSDIECKGRNRVMIVR